jgi:hypothetical protein
MKANKPQWLIDAETLITEFDQSKFGKMNNESLAKSLNASAGQQFRKWINENPDHQSNAGKIGGKSKSEAKIKHILEVRQTWAETSKYRDPKKVLYNAKHNGGTGKVRDCIYCGRTINLMNIGRHEAKCNLQT